MKLRFGFKTPAMLQDTWLHWYGISTNKFFIGILIMSPMSKPKDQK